MREILKIFLLLILLVVGVPSHAKDSIKMISHINHDFDISSYMPDEVSFRTKKKITITDGVTIPQRSIVTADVIQAQKELRWHKSGCIICKLKYYVTESSDEVFDISDKNIYFIARKYEKVNKKEASILATELIVFSGASFFAPGVDVLYFFTKGAIQRHKHPNWFKAGVSNAYDNSICWLWLKGKPINLKQYEEIKLVSINEKKAMSLKEKIEKRKIKQAKKDQKKLIKTLIHNSKKNNKILVQDDSGDVILISDLYDTSDNILYDVISESTSTEIVAF